MARRMAGTICLSIGVTNRLPKILHRSATITRPQTAISSPHQVAIYTGPFSDRHSSLPTNYHTGPNTSKQFHFEAIIIPQQRSVGVFCHRKDFGADSERASEQVPDEVPQRIRRRCGKRFRSRFRRRFRGRFQRRFGRRLREKVLEKVPEQVPKQTRLRRAWTAKRLSQWRFVLLGTLLALMPLARPTYNHKSRLHLSSQRHRDTEP